jgi:hypothetical protein
LARVQLFEGGSTAEPQPTGARFQAQDYGPGIGAGLEKLGEAGQQAAGVLDQVQQWHDEAAVKEATNKINEWYAGAAYTGPNALFSKLGKDALTTAPLVTQGLTNEIANSRQGLQNDRQRFLFDEAVKPQQIDWQTQIGKHVVEQTRTYATNEATARAGMTAEMAGLTYLDDPKQGEDHIATMNAEIAKAGQLQGWGPDQIAAKQFTATSGIYKDVGTQIASAGPQGWDLARTFVEQHKGSMSDDDRASVLDRADTEQRQAEAAQRAAEAEARRQQNEAERAARDRVQSAIDGPFAEGIPMDPGQYSSVLDDAKATGDPNLIKRVQDAQLKNTTLFAHQHDTPLDLQNQINGLSAQIAKAGTKVDPNLIIQRNALQQLYGNSSSQLKSNGIGWAADHLGMPVQPLNLSDPASIDNRLELVTAASKRAGQAIDPLQPDEVTPLTQQWRTGSAQAKLNLVAGLARMGPLATAAAQQVAPNDNGLIHLVGLASHSNRGVGLSRVSQAIAGYEAMKTEAPLVNKLASPTDFNAFTGTALQFMPGARDGVLTTAKALLAEDAASHGWKDNNDADDKAWYRAVNSALGAYSRGSVQYGGLAGFNGAQTILPENMSLDDFEGRIARANGPQMRSAANGAPLAGDGSALNAGDLKKMHYIPVGDGIYRLENGGAFVHTKDGQPFEIDVRKLPAPGAQAAASPDFNAQLAAHGYARY